MAPSMLNLAIFIANFLFVRDWGAVTSTNTDARCFFAYRAPVRSGVMGTTGCGGWIRTNDPKVMSLMRYRAALLRSVDNGDKKVG